MSAALTSALQNFVEYFGGLGPRWGLDGNACRVHAYLYLSGRAASADEIAAALAMDGSVVRDGLRYLVEYRMLRESADGTWRVEGDPWDMLLGGLEERRRREIGPALQALQQCRDLALAEAPADRGLSLRLSKLLGVVEDLAALDSQARRLSPNFVKGVIGVSGRLARLADRAFGPRKGGV